MDKLKEKQAELKKLAEQIRKLTESAKDGWTPEQREQMKSLRASYGTVNGEVSQLKEDADNAAFASQLEEDHDRAEKEHRDTESKRRLDKSIWSNRQRADAFIARIAPGLASDEHRALAAQMSVGLGDNGGQVFRALLDQQPTLEQLRPDNFRALREEQRAQTIGTATAGGNLVPDEMMRELEWGMLNYNAVRRSGAEVIRTATGADLPIPYTNDTANTASIVTEGVTIAETDATISQVVLQAYAYASLVKVSFQLMRDSSVSVSAMLGRMLGERIGRGQSAHDTTGTGTSQPNGIVTWAADSSVTTASNTAVTKAELADIFESVDQDYAGPSSGWMMDQVVRAYVRALDPNAATISSDIVTSAAAFDFPLYANNNMATGASAKAILFGNFAYYKLRDVIDIEILQLNERFADQGLVGFIGWHRHDADGTVNAAVKYATLAA